MREGPLNLTRNHPVTPDVPANDQARFLTEAERKAEQKAAKKADKKAARDKANRARQMGARRRK